MALKKYVFILTIIFGNWLLFGCSSTTVTTSNPTVQETLELYAEADIFLWDNVVYLTNIDWVDELVLTEGDLIGIIKFNTSNPSEFTNSTANILPVGTEIYAAQERKDILIAKHAGELKYYYMLVEG